MQSDDAPELTPRQLECLQWAALGKSGWETARIINRSESAVNEHRWKAARRLNCINITHACVKAALLGLISVEGI